MNAHPRDGSSGPPEGIKRYLIENYDEIHAIAAKQMAKENAGNSMQATALLNEAVCKMLDPDQKVQINDSRHFLAAANVMMKNILIDRARRRNAAVRGGQITREELHEDQVGSDPHHVEMLIIQEEIQLLAAQDPLAALIIQKRCEGYSIDEVAVMLKLSRTQAYSQWNFGRAWLLQKFHQSSSQTD